MLCFCFFFITLLEAHSPPILLVWVKMQSLRKNCCFRHYFETAFETQTPAPTRQSVSSIADRGDRLAALGPPHPGIALLAIALMSFDTREANMKGVASNGSMPQEVVRDFLLELRSGAPNDKDIIIGPPLGVGGRSISCIGRIINLLHFLIQNSSGDLQLRCLIAFFFFFFHHPFGSSFAPILLVWLDACRQVYQVHHSARRMLAGFSSAFFFFFFFSSPFWKLIRPDTACVARRMSAGLSSAFCFVFVFFSSPFWKLIRPDTACVG